MLDAMITWTSDLVHHSGLHDLIQADPTPTPSGGGGGIPQPENGVRPPGAEKFETMLGWAKWGALFCCVAASSSSAPGWGTSTSGARRAATWEVWPSPAPPASSWRPRFSSLRNSPGPRRMRGLA